MKTYWIKLPPRTRALGVFLATFVLAMLGFSITGGLEQVDLLFGIYIGGLVTYFLARWGTFATRVALILPGQELTTYEKFRKNPGRRRRGQPNPQNLSILMKQMKNSFPTIESSGYFITKKLPPTHWQL